MEYQLPLIVIFVLGFPVLMMTITNRLYAQYRVANMAQRVGLTTAEGNPKLNLMNAYPLHNFKMGTGTGGSRLSRFFNETKRTKVRLVGAPHGRPTEFVYHRREDTKVRLLVVTTESWFECRLSLQVPVAFPEFEIVRRRPAMRVVGVYAIKARPELPMPPQPFGKPESRPQIGADNSRAEARACACARDRPARAAGVRAPAGPRWRPPLAGHRGGLGARYPPPAGGAAGARTDRRCAERPGAAAPLKRFVRPSPASERVRAHCGR